MALLDSSTSSAYRCDRSGDNGGGTINGHKLEYDNGSCVYFGPDNVDNDKRDFVPNPSHPDGGTYRCTDGAVLHDDGNCWNYRRHYTNAKPTYDDGTPVPRQVWEDMCSDIDEGWGRPGHHYHESRHRCESANGCVGMDDTSVREGRSPGQAPWQFGECRQLGSGSDPPEDPTSEDNNSDDERCADGSMPNPETGRCADGSTPGSGSGHVIPPPEQEDFQECGEADTVLVACGADNCGITGDTFSGAPVIGCVLKFGIQALTVLIGIGAVGGIAWEAMQYARAQDDQSVVSNARKRIRDIVIGIVVYVFMIAVLQWLIPGMVIG